MFITVRREVGPVLGAEDQRTARHQFFSPGNLSSRDNGQSDAGVFESFLRFGEVSREDGLLGQQYDVRRRRFVRVHFDELPAAEVACISKSPLRIKTPAWSARSEERTVQAEILIQRAGQCRVLVNAQIKCRISKRM